MLPTVDAGRNEWISVYFKTDHKVCDFKMRVRGAQVEILHPNDWDYTSLNQNSTLRHKEVDYAAFRVNADVDETEWIPLSATITWNDCGADDETREKKTSLVLPVRA